MKKYLGCYFVGLLAMINLVIYTQMTVPHLEVIDIVGRRGDPYDGVTNAYFIVNLLALLFSIISMIVMKYAENKKIGAVKGNPSE